MSKPTLEEMTFKQLIDEATWLVVQQLINGTARDGVVDAVNLYAAWREALQAPQLEAMRQEAELYRFWRDKACSEPGRIAKLLAECVTPEQIDAALRSELQGGEAEPSQMVEVRTAGLSGKALDWARWQPKSEQPKTFACNHNGPTCRACHGSVIRWLESELGDVVSVPAELVGGDA